MHVIAAKAVAFKEARREDFKRYQQQVVKNAAALAEELMQNGIELVSGGTDNHMILADLSGLGTTGKDAEDLLGRVGITVNKNAVPFDRQPPSITSGIRIGTPAVTTRGMSEKEMLIIAGLIADVLKQPKDSQTMERVKSKVQDLCDMFPFYQEIDEGDLNA
jgi:glycine hydroxymethyltransferase